MTYTALPGSARRGRLAFACVAAVACAGLASRRGGPAAPAAASSLKSDARGGTRITTDDDTDDRTVYNPTLHVYRDHHHTAHHHSLTKNPEKTWTTDDRSHDDDDVMGYDARGAGAGVLNHTYCGLVLTKNTQKLVQRDGDVRVVRRLPRRVLPEPRGLPHRLREVRLRAAARGAARRQRVVALVLRPARRRRARARPGARALRRDGRDLRGRARRLLELQRVHGPEHCPGTPRTRRRTRGASRPRARRTSCSRGRASAACRSTRSSRTCRTRSACSRS